MKRPCAPLSAPPSPPMSLGTVAAGSRSPKNALTLSTFTATGAWKRPPLNAAANIFRCLTSKLKT